MTREIRKNKKSLTKKAVGTERIGNAYFTIRGVKSPFSKGRYEVLVEIRGKKVFDMEGSFDEVLSAMKEHRKAREGKGLLEEMSQAIAGPGDSLTGCFSHKELVYLAALMDGPRTLDELVIITNIHTTNGFEVMEDMQMLGLIQRREKKGKSPREYSITSRGERIVKLLTEDERFKEIRRKVEKGYP